MKITKRIKIGRGSTYGPRFWPVGYFTNRYWFFQPLEIGKIEGFRFITTENIK